MKFSLWAGENYVQSSDDVNRLKCNVNQLRTWCDAMGIENLSSRLTVKDNSKDSVIAFAQYTVGTAIRWKTPENAAKNG